MLKLQNLSTNKLLKNISLEIKKGKKYALLGPNGSGKTTLFSTIIGLSKDKVKSGEILFNNKSILKKSPDARYNLGIVSVMQNPPVVKGVKLDTLASELTDYSSYWDFLNKAREIKSEQFLEREIGRGLSGGEIKRSELLLASLHKNPRLFLFDEIDSGVDIENLPLIGKFVKKLISQKDSSAIFITHTLEILKYVKVDEVIIMLGGEIKCIGDPKQIIPKIKKYGFEKCINCNAKQK